MDDGSKIGMCMYACMQEAASVAHAPAFWHSCSGPGGGASQRHDYRHWLQVKRSISGQDWDSLPPKPYPQHQSKAEPATLQQSSFEWEFCGWPSKHRPACSWARGVSSVGQPVGLEAHVCS